MANSIYPIKITPRGSSNREAIAGLKTGRIPYPIGWVHWFRQRVRFGASVDFTQAAATSQEIDLHAAYPHNLFPANVQRLPGTFLRVPTPLSGASISAVTIEVGDSGDPNGIFLATSVFTGAPAILASTPNAAENAARTELSFIPTITVRTTGANVSALVGEVTVFIPWRVLVP
jgi:hypothetical protein